MAKKSKTPVKITQDEKEIIDRIVFSCSGKIYHFLKMHRDPKKYAKELPKLWSSEKTLFLPNLLFATMNMSEDELIFPDELKTKVAEAIPHDEEDVTGAILDLKKKQKSTYLKSWAATEAFQGLANEGLLSNISGKSDIRKIAPPQKLKKGRGVKREGKYSAYMITVDLGALNKVISKPEALKIIHQKLIKYGRLEEFFLFFGLASVYAMRESDDTLNNFFNVAAQASLDNIPSVQDALSRAGLNSKEIQYSLWELIKNHLRSIKEEDLEVVARKMIRPLIENSIDYRYTLLAISKS